MRRASNCLDKGIAKRLLRHGVFLSSKVPPLTQEQGLMLLAEAAVDRFVREFKGLVGEMLSGCQLSDFQATSYEIQGWFANAPEAARRAEENRESSAPPRIRGTDSYSNMCKEVDETMKFDMQSKLDEYLQLFEQIKVKTRDESTAMALLQEVCKDRRSVERREERETKASEAQDSPATEKQKNYLKNLNIKFPAAVTKQEASMLLDEALGKNSE